MNKPAKPSWNKLTMFKVPCQYCGEVQERNKPSTNVTCFDCKVNRRRLQHLNKKKGDVSTVKSRNRGSNNKLNNNPDDWPWLHKPTNK